MTNQELVNKADMALADLASGGLLNPEQSAAFVRKLINEPTMIRSARIVEMANPKKEINKIGFGTRILRKGVESTALDPADRSKPTTSKVTLDTKEVIAEVRLPYAVIEDNIKRGSIGAMTDVGGSALSGGIRDTIRDLIAERAALDLEELGLLGDTGSGDTYLALVDGWLKAMTSHVVNHAGATIDKSLFKNGIKAMPDPYLRNRSAMRHFVSVDNETEYRDTLANRQTALGDSQIQATGPVYGFGVPVTPVALMPADKGIFCDPKNLIFGIQRAVTMEFDKIITDRVYLIVLTARVDFKIEEEDATVKYTSIG